eukprot:SAG31_NODE_32057_length_360_cov_1.375479_1_plen_77_part_01
MALMRAAALWRLCWAGGVCEGWVNFTSVANTIALKLDDGEAIYSLAHRRLGESRAAPHDGLRPPTEPQQEILQGETD